VEAVRFTQFRNISRIKLSLLYGYAGNTELSIQYAIAASKDGLEIRGYSPVYQTYRCPEIHDKILGLIGADKPGLHPGVLDSKQKFRRKR
jgi:hypothetical protein